LFQEKKSLVFRHHSGTMNKTPSPEKLNNSRREKLFRIIAVSLPLVFIVLIELVLRLFGAGDDLHLFVQNETEGYEETLIVNPVVGKKYFRTFEYTEPPNDIFLKQKKDNTFRIFVMGSSTVVGFPHGRNLMFSRILHKRLEDAFPEKHIEVVNTAITAINSFTLMDFAGQVARYEPDAVLIYAGHNEFYGAFGIGSNEGRSGSSILIRMNMTMMDSRLYQVLSGIGKGKESDVHGTLMKRIVGNPDIPLDSEAYRLAMDRYRENMTGVIGEFTRRGIPVYYSEVVSNVKDIRPLSALSTGEENEAWEVYLEGARAYNAGDYDNALELFKRARDLDGIRFRASSDINRIIGEIAAESGASLVSMESLFRDHSPHGIIGGELMTEHVHPNIRGSFLMAEGFLDALLNSDLLRKVSGSDSRLKSMAYEKRNWGYTELDSLYALHRVAQLKTHWPFVPAEAVIPDYRLSHQPDSRRDSLAFEAFRNPEVSLEEARLGLAREYEAEGNLFEAYREYESILRTNPYLAINYRDAASMLIRLGHLPLALDYFRRSLEFDDSFYARYRIGEILLIKGDYRGARDAFREAFDIAGDNEDKLRTLGKLYQACTYGGMADDAESIAEQLRNYGETGYLRIPRKSYTFGSYIPYRTRSTVEEARRLMSGGMYDTAAAELEASLEVFDSHVVRRLLGDCYLALQDTVAAGEQYDMVSEAFAFDPSFPPVPLTE